MTGFAVWAPEQPRVRVRTAEATVELARAERGWWRADVPVGPGDRYAFLLGDEDRELPDPRSPRQPLGVHGPSECYDHAAFAWTDADWTGRTLPGSVLYELHVGTFTPEGTFDAAIGKLDHLVDLGVDLVELMPVSAFNGPYNWGYDGVCWYAPHEPYGGPDGLKRLVDACHRKGLGVVLDVVYNHFGPSGAYAQEFAPYLSAAHTPWGRSLNLDGPGSDEVHAYVRDSVLMWLRDYHVDGLRLDAVHALRDSHAVHLLEELAVEVEALAAHLRRPLTLIAESDLNDVRVVTPREAGGLGLAAQWNDDVHHAVHALLTGERQGYYADFGSAECLATVLREVFRHTGTFSGFRRRSHGRPVDRTRVPGHRFVAYLQNHDQIGNRASGDRISARLDPHLVRVGAMLLLTGPFTPLLFMGEEWAAGTPWRYFTSHPERELARAVSEGRRRELAGYGYRAEEICDPQAPATFAGSKLDWTEPDREPHRGMLAFYRDLIALRRVRPELTDPRLDRLAVWHGEEHLGMRRGDCAVVANLANRPQRLAVPGRPGALLLATGPGVALLRDAVVLPPRSACVLELTAIPAT